jgi:hypothetical protein
MNATSARTAFSYAELTASHAYRQAHQVRAWLFHGGFMADGGYLPPRSLHRPSAIEAWSDRLEQRGWPLIDCGPAERTADVFPNFEQHRVLLVAGCRRCLWDELTIVAVNEGKGEAMCHVPLMDLQAVVEDDLDDTLTGHLWKGLFWSHGVDEAGDRKTPGVGGHKQMWLAVRDLLFGEERLPWPQIDPMHTRPKAQAREAPALPLLIERLVESCMATLNVECRAYPVFQLCLDLCGRPELFAAPAADVALAGSLIRRIRADEASHVAYLRCLLSELRSFTFRGLSGEKIVGADLWDPIWRRQLEWPDRAARAARHVRIRETATADARDRLSPVAAEAAIAEFDALSAKADHG